MFDFSGQALDNLSRSGLNDVSLFGLNGSDYQYFSKKGIQLGPISYSNGSLSADLLWDASTLQQYSSRSKTEYSVLLSLVGPDSSVEYIEDITSSASSIYSSKIPESVDFDLSDYIDEITGGSSLYLGISQVSKTGRLGKGTVAMATSIDLTDLITGQSIPNQLNSVDSSNGSNIYVPKSTTSCQNKRIGIDADLQDCKFEYVNLDGVKFGYSDQDKPPASRKPVNLSGSSFEGSSLKNTEWGWDGYDIVENPFQIEEVSFAQQWTSRERKNQQSGATSLRRSNLENARFILNNKDPRGSGPSHINSATTDPNTPPFVDYANLTGVNTSSWEFVQEKQSPTFVTVTNQSDRDVTISSIVTNMFRPWSTVLSSGKSFQAWGTTGQYRGNDIVIDSPGVQIAANNPTFSEANVKVNDDTVYDSDTIRYAGGGVYVNWLGDQNNAKTWEIKFVN